MGAKRLGLPSKINWLALAAYLVMLGAALLVARRYANPAPPSRIVIATGADEGDYQTYAALYRSIIKKSGIELSIRQSTGTVENLRLLKDPKSAVDVAFVQDGLDDSEEESRLVSLGSLYYEPLWVFYPRRHGQPELSRFSQLSGKRLAIGEPGGGTQALAVRILKASGVDGTNTRLLYLSYVEAVQALRKGEIDAGFFLTTADDDLIKPMLADPNLRLMSADQAEAITRQLPFLNHLVLPHGAIDLQTNLPDQDVHLVASTATLVAREGLHPALIDLLLLAATEVHAEPGFFEKKGEFPIDKDYDFRISPEAKRFYKSGERFWLRYLPFWVANLAERFIHVVIPLLALLFPLFRTVPRLREWWIKSGIYKRYGELKYLETQMKAETDRQKFAEHLRELDGIEDRVNHMKVPLEYSEHLYGLREHIEFVRGKLTRA